MKSEVISYPSPQEILELEHRLSGDIEIFSNLLFKWGKVHNLIANVGEEEVLKHVRLSLAFSLVVLREILDLRNRISEGFSGVRIADVGSGAGFPGLFLALFFEKAVSGKVVLSKDLEIRLYEVRSKRAAFLRRAAIELGLKRLLILRERFSCSSSGFYDIVTGRAVMPPEEFLKNFSDCSGRIIYMGSRGFWRGYRRFYEASIPAGGMSIVFWAGVGFSSDFHQLENPSPPW